MEEKCPGFNPHSSLRRSWGGIIFSYLRIKLGFQDCDPLDRETRVNPAMI